MIHVLATIELADGKRDAFLQEFHQLVPFVHAEQGCIEYGPTIDAVTDISAQATAGENVVTVVEKWDSVEALKAHLVAPHMLSYREKVSGLVKSSRILVLEPA